MVQRHSNQYVRRAGPAWTADRADLLGQARQPVIEGNGRIEPVQITRDAILDGKQIGVARYVVTLGTPGGSTLEVLSVDRSGLAVTGFAVSPRTGALYRFVQTGRHSGRPTGKPVVQVRAIPAVDIGDLAGTLRFDPMGGTVAGTVSSELACNAGTAAAHPQCPPHLLCQLLRHPNPEISQAAAANPNLPRAALAMWQLAHNT